MKQTGIYLLLLFGLSLHYGRMFEIFSWNSNIIRIESIAQKSFSDQTGTCHYSQLNHQYWEEKAYEDSKIRIDFSERYLYLNRRAEDVLGENQDRYLLFMPELTKRFLFNISYSDDYLFV